MPAISDAWTLSCPFWRCERMTCRFTAGDAVQTPLGKGGVREVRNNGRLLVDVGGRAVVFDEAGVTALEGRKKGTGTKKAAGARAAADVAALPNRSPAIEVDLHGFTVEQALALVEEALNRALLADSGELRLIHGRSGGRIRGAVHRWLREISTVRAFRLDPRNAGVTIVTL